MDLGIVSRFANWEVAGWKEIPGASPANSRTRRPCNGGGAVIVRYVYY